MTPGSKELLILLVLPIVCWRLWGGQTRRQAPSTSEPEAVAGADCVQSTFLFRSPPFQKGLYLNIFPFFAPARLQLEEEVLKKVEGHQKKL